MRAHDRMSPELTVVSPRLNMAQFTVGFDIGGTFTDFVLLDRATGGMRIHKHLTTPIDPASGALEGLMELLAQAGLTLEQVGCIIHGTTLVANAIIERRGTTLAMLTTRGFRDVLEAGIEQRYDIYDLFLRFPEPLVPRHLIGEVDERVTRDGEILVPIALEQVRKLVAGLVAQGADAIAVCFLHAYKNPVHERTVGELLRQEFPDLSISLSSEVVPELREYMRATTTAANAYVQPLMEQYISRLEEELRRCGFAGRFYLMQSSGGMASPSIARQFPIRLLESGPVGGALVTAVIGAQAGHPDVLSFDMGGTTAKACLIQKGRPDKVSMMEAGRVHRFKRGSGIPVEIPVIDMVEIGAGGGSIARIDSLSLLKIGPGSAGADPGPACYGFGGLEPTVTDADLILGYLNPEYFLGGRMRLDVAKAEAAVQRVAAPLGLSVTEAALGIYNVVNENMATAARAHIIEKGRDPRRYAMVGFGGAGPAHAGRVARILGMSEVIIPGASGAASALGFLVAPLSFDFVNSLPGILHEMDWGAVNRLMADMEGRGREMLVEAGVVSGQIVITRRAEMRLLGQVHNIEVPLPPGPLGPTSIPAIQAAFEAEYQHLYSQMYGGSVIQVINWRLLCSGPEPQINLAETRGVLVDAPKLKGSREAYFPELGGYVDIKVYNRYALRPGDVIAGPAIVEERESTTIVCPGDRLRVDASYHMVIQVQRATVPEIRVSAGMPITEAMAHIEADAVALEIIWSRLINVAEECWLTVWRTAFSLIIGEAQDFGCELLDAYGNSLAHSPRSMPVFNLTLPRAVKELLKKFPSEALQPGDVLCTNDPWICAGHLSDIAVVTPVFRKGRVVALIGTIGHVASIGGTKDSLRAREVYEEGLQIPPIKLCRAGVLNQDLIDIIAENVRKSDQVLGDIHAMLSANAAAAQRLLETLDEYGLENLEALAAVIQRRTEQATREAIRRLPPGEYASEVWADGMGTPLRIPLKVNVTEDHITVDWAGAPPQFSQGGANCTFSYTAAHTLYPLKCMLTPEVPSNAGCFLPFDVLAPKGSIFNCRKPVAVDNRVRAGWYISPNLFMALAPAVLDRVQGFTGPPVIIPHYGQLADGRFFDDNLFQGGGQGASAHGDGKSGLLWPTSAANTSVELFETRAPVLVLTREFRTDSGGPGRFRGGLGRLVRVRKLNDDDCPVYATPQLAGVLTEIQGLLGGRPGAPARVRVVSPEGVQECGIGGFVILTNPRQVLEVEAAGGSGYGPPWERRVEAVQRDLDEGYVSPEGAQREYYCVVRDGRVDVAATAALRSKLAGLPGIRAPAVGTS
jgi:5-oxoprolinase (ATP-hydrolysing)